MPDKATLPRQEPQTDSCRIERSSFPRACPRGSGEGGNPTIPHFSILSVASRHVRTYNSPFIIHSEYPCASFITPLSNTRFVYGVYGFRIGLSLLALALSRQIDDGGGTCQCRGEGIWSRRRSRLCLGRRSRR